MWTRGQVSLRVANVTWTDFDSSAFILQLFNNFYNASEFVCSICEAMPGSLSVASTAASSTNVAVVDSVDVCRSVLHISGVTTAPGHWPGVHPLWLRRVLVRNMKTQKVLFTGVSALFKRHV
jgi:hypothetical protein